MHQFDSVAKAKLQNSDIVLNYEFEIRTGSYNPKPLTQKQYTQGMSALDVAKTVSQHVSSETNRGEE